MFYFRLFHEIQFVYSYYKWVSFGVTLIIQMGVPGFNIISNCHTAKSDEMFLIYHSQPSHKKHATLRWNASPVQFCAIVWKQLPIRVISGQAIVPTLGIKMKSKDIISRRTNEWMKFPLDIIHGQRGKHTYYLTGCNIVLHPPHVGVYHTQETPTCKPTVTQEHTLYNSNP